MTPRGEPPEVEWLDDAAPATHDEELPQPREWNPERRRAARVAGALAAVGLVVIAVVIGIGGSDDGERPAGDPVIPSYASGSESESSRIFHIEPGRTFEIPPGSMVVIPDPDRPARLFDPRTGRASPDVPVARCEGRCERFEYASPKVIAAVRARFPHVQEDDVFAVTIFDHTGLVGRTISARSGDLQIRVFIVRTPRPSSDEVERLVVRGRSLVRVRLHISFVQVAVSADRVSGSISTSKVVSLARDQRLLDV